MPKPDNIATKTLAKLDEFDAMPRAEITENPWTPEQRAAFVSARCGRNWLLLAVLGGFCLIIYAIALVKLHEYGRMW